MIELRQHQREALDRLQNGNILCGMPGSGKTFVGVMYYMEREIPKDVYVITPAKKRNDLDWQRDFAKVAIGMTDDSTVGGKLTVDSYNNIEKYKEVKDGFFIFDEQRLVGNGTWVKSFLKIAKNNRWIMLSGTPGDTWSDFIPVFIANGYYDNKTDFVRQHVVFRRYVKFPQIERYVGVKKLLDIRRRVCVEMPYASSVITHDSYINVEYDKGLYREVRQNRWNVFEERPIRNAAELFLVSRKIVTSDPTRSTAIETIWSKHPKLIIFYNFNYELDILRQLAEDMDVVSAEYNGHKHEPVPTGDKWLYFVQYTSGAEAWNCITTDTIVFYSLSYAYRAMLQAKGRINRLNTPFTDLYYYMLVSSAPSEKGNVRALKEKRDFNERELYGNGTKSMLHNQRKPVNAGKSVEH